MSIPLNEPSAELNALQQVVGDRYQPLVLLGKKSGRKTLLAQDLKGDRKVVIKLLTFGEDFNWDDLKLFEREAETLRSLDHPAIPKYLDYFDVETPTSKGFALVQSYIEARSLEEQVKSGRRLSEKELDQLVLQLLEILEYLHSRQPAVIHRDIKPSNILLTEKIAHSVGQVYLVDFGSVQTLAAREGGTITVVGTYGYMPPEQFGGRAVPASDLYSLGATLIYLASGWHPADLPQDDLRLGFEEFVQLSPKRVRWLKTLIEPSLSRRFKSAKEASLEQYIDVGEIKTSSVNTPSSFPVPVQADEALPIRLSHPRLSSSFQRFSQNSDAVSFKLPSAGVKIISIERYRRQRQRRQRRGDTSCMRLLLIVLVVVVVFSILLITVLVAGPWLALLGFLGGLAVIANSSNRADASMATFSLSAYEIQLQWSNGDKRTFARHHAWQLQRESSCKVNLLIGSEQLAFTVSEDDAQWLSHLLSVVLQLPEESLA